MNDVTIESIDLRKQNVFSGGYAYLRLKGTAKLTIDDHKVDFNVSAETISKISELIIEDAENKLTKAFK